MGCENEKEDVVNKERIVLVVAMALFGLGVALTLNDWTGDKTFKPPSLGSKGVKVSMPRIDVGFADEDDAIDFKSPKRNIFIPMLETVDLPPAQLPAPPLPNPERVAPPPYPAPGYSDLSSLLEAAPDVNPPGEDEEDDEEDEEPDDNRRW